ncbi:Predicted thiol-disulfide oxidoreductase YuxK, DCC family [Streptomyces sp. 1222.5]|nr:putative DCC family thiol-disulfide oxidoreductase YuxK [Streptomyces sp. 5112.2]SED40832.1 Predicted thiol-disulfide oxidoreductase YuxK, DCC family [Streptomyces sp. 1222.5]
MEGMRTQPVLVYDGDCGFCTASVAFARKWIKPRCEITAQQAAPLEALGVTRQRAEYEALWVTPEGTVHGGAQAVAGLLSSAGGGWMVVGALLRLPPMRWIAHGVYRLIADNRHRLPGGTAACALTAGGSGSGRGAKPGSG